MNVDVPVVNVDDLLPRCQFPPRGTALPCAFSGGPDSTALLVLARAAGCDVVAIHVDHGLRPTSATEARQAAALAAAIGVPFRARRVTIAPGPNLEARARAARRAALPDDAATGHTADDQAETVLINLLRGAGINGLAGMRAGPRHPLLALRRHETRALCESLGLTPVADPSNHDRRFVRNRVRDEVLPLLADVAGRDVVPLLARGAAVLAGDAHLLDELATSIDPTDARALAARATSARPPGAARLAHRRRRASARSRQRRARARGRQRRGARLRGRRRPAGRASPPAPHPDRSGACHHRTRWRSSSNLDRRYGQLRSRRRVALMATKLRGRWALGITPRHFTWILKDKLAICERPGGYGTNHRRVRRQEEIIWIRENGFGCVISIIPAPHNLHNYDELGVTSRHRPFNADDPDPWLRSFYRELHELLRNGTKVIVHGEEVGDRIVGIMGGYIRWEGLVDDDTAAITVTERIAGRQLDPFARNVILGATRLR